MSVAEIRKKFLAFFEQKGHAIIPSASLIPENDPTVLFTTAGMHPLVPYLLGESHPSGQRLANAQKCLRTDDIEEVGDNRHLTFFEMLGNWSLGDYFKPEAIGWSFEFLTDAHWLGLDPARLFVTVFAGDADAPHDEESFSIWQALFMSHGVVAHAGVASVDEPAQEKNGPRIYAYGKKKNWWGPAGQTGPCGPDTEMFYDTGRVHDPAFGAVCHPNCDCGRFVEIWNDVFMQYAKQADGTFVPLARPNVDTGMGLERIAAVLHGVPTVFDIEAFQTLFKVLEDLSGKKYLSRAGLSAEHELINRSFRIIADHVRAAVFIIGDPRGVTPSNIGQGYVVRRLLRRAIREGRRLGIRQDFLVPVAQTVINEFGGYYQELTTNADRILIECQKEEEKFGKTLEKGLSELEKSHAINLISGKDGFTLFQTYGFPKELIQEELRNRGYELNEAEFDVEFKKHQALSRAASAGAFKGGLADHSVESTRLHTATHLLHRALKNVLGEHVEQRGSNITAERLRFDFSHGQKMTPNELQRVELLVNQVINQDLPVHFEDMTVAEAKAQGVIGLFEDKYARLGNKVKVYFVGDSARGYFSQEICGGPHVAHTGELGSFKILKEEAVSAGVRRIKATVAGAV